MSQPVVLVLEWLPDGVLDQWQRDFPDCEILDGRNDEICRGRLKDATIIYGFPPLERLSSEAKSLRWLQLASAGVPRRLCPTARDLGLTVTNLAGLYGPTIAEHALAMMLMIARQLHTVVRQQQERKWDRKIRETMVDLAGRTVAIVGVGNIGRHVARLSKAFGMRVIGCRRTVQDTPSIDRIYSCKDLKSMLAEADFVVVAAPLTTSTEGMIGSDEFKAMKPGCFFVNVSRGAIADESALLVALQSGQVAAAALDAFAVEPLADDHLFWDMPQVVVSPHYSGETVNLSTMPAERFIRNLRSWQRNGELEGVVNLDQGY